LRAVHLFFWSRTPYWDGLFLDELYHHLWAQKIAAGEILPKSVFFRAPLYPYLMAAIYRVFGAEPGAVRIFQNLFGLVSVIFFWKLSHRIFKDARLAALATFLWAINPLQIFYESRLLLDSVVSAGTVILFYLAIETRFVRRDFLIFLTGFWLGILGITRPTVLVFAPVIFLYFWRYFKFRAAVIFVGLIFPIAPVSLFNYINGDRVLIASQGGINFYIGNNPQSDGASAIVPEFGYNWRYVDCVKAAQDSVGRPLLPSEVSKFYWRRGFLFWKKSPAKAFLLLLKKIALFFNGAEIGNNGNIYFLTRRTPLFVLIYLGLGWGLLLPLALAGVFYRKIENKALLGASFLAYSGVVVIFFVCSRFKLPVIPLLTIFSAAGVGTLADWIRRGKFLPLAGILLAGVAANIDYFHWRRTDDPLSHFALGNIYLRRGEDFLAKHEYETALGQNPTMRGVNLNLGALYFREGKIDSAVAHFRREVNIGGEKCRALSNLGVIARMRGDSASALLFGEQAYKLCPSDPAVVFNYAFSLYLYGRYHLADSILADFAELYPDDPRVLNLWGVVNLALGDTAAAEELFRDVLSVPPKSFVQMYDLGTIYSEQSGLGGSPEKIKSRAYFNLGQILMGRKKVSGAAQMFALAVQLDPSFARGWFALGAIALAKNDLENAEKYLKQALKNGERSPELFFNLAAVKIRQDEPDSAVYYLRRALEVDPNFLPARYALERLSAGG